MAVQDLDDGWCYQINTSHESFRRQSDLPNHPPDQPDARTEQWCKTDVRIHDKVHINSTITIYWVWDWRTAPGTKDIACGKDEYYTSCLDFEVTADNSRNLQDRNLKSTRILGQQDPQTKAVHAHKSRNAPRKRPIIIAKGSCGNQSDATATYTITDTKLDAEIESSPDPLVPRQSFFQMTAYQERKSLITSTEGQNLNLEVVNTATTTITMTTTTSLQPIVTITI